MLKLKRWFDLSASRNGINFKEWPPALTKSAGGLSLIALAVPGVGVARVARCGPDAPDAHAVGVDVDVALVAVVGDVDALPSVCAAASELCGPARLPVLVLALGGEITAVELVRVPRCECSNRSNEYATEDECSSREAYCNLFLETHDEPFY